MAAEPRVESMRRTRVDTSPAELLPPKLGNRDDFGGFSTGNLSGSSPRRATTRGAGGKHLASQARYMTRTNAPVAAPATGKALTPAESRQHRPSLDQAALRKALD